MFTIKAIRRDRGNEEVSPCEVQTVVSVDYYEIRKAETTAYPSVIGYKNDGVIVCHHEVFLENDDFGSAIRCDEVFITNSEGRTVDSVRAPRQLIDCGPRNVAVA